MRQGIVGNVNDFVLISCQHRSSVLKTNDCALSGLRNQIFFGRIFYYFLVMGTVAEIGELCVPDMPRQGQKMQHRSCDDAKQRKKRPIPVSLFFPECFNWQNDRPNRPRQPQQDHQRQEKNSVQTIPKQKPNVA